MTLTISVLVFCVGFIGGFSVAAFMRKIRGNVPELLRTLMGLAILVLVGYSTATSLAAADRLEALGRCQNAANQQTAASQVAVREAATRQDVANRDFSAAQLGLLNTPPTSSPAERKAAFDKYVEAVGAHIKSLDDLIASRTAHPLPPPAQCDVPEQ